MRRSPHVAAPRRAAQHTRPESALPSANTRGYVLWARRDETVLVRAGAVAGRRACCTVWPVVISRPSPVNASACTCTMLQHTPTPPGNLAGAAGQQPDQPAVLDAPDADAVVARRGKVCAVLRG